MRYKFAEVNDRGDTTDWEVKTMMPPGERPDGAQLPDLQFSNALILTCFGGYAKWGMALLFTALAGCEPLR